MVAMRRYKSGAGAVGALGKAFYKGGFEPRMNKREAALILQLRYGSTPLSRRYPAWAWCFIQVCLVDVFH